LSVHGYFDTPQDIRRRKAPAAPKAKTCGVTNRKLILGVTAKIEANGWDPETRAIGAYMLQRRDAGAVPYAMEWIQQFTRCSVLVWERQPGRTQEQVLALLREALA
jgi:hypothetical protein